MSWVKFLRLTWTVNCCAKRVDLELGMMDKVSPLGCKGIRGWVQASNFGAGGKGKRVLGIRNLKLGRGDGETGWG